MLTNEFKTSYENSHKAKSKNEKKYTHTTSNTNHNNNNKSGNGSGNYVKVFKMVFSFRRFRSQRRNGERLSFVSNEINESIDKPLESIDWVNEGREEKEKKETKKMRSMRMSEE